MPPESQPGAAPRVVASRLIRRGRQQALTLDDGREFTFSSEVCSRLGVGIGTVLDDAAVCLLDAENQRAEAHEAALRLLTTRARSEGEIRSRLRQRGIAGDIADAEVTRLREAGLLDDEAFAAMYVADRSRMAPRAARLVRQELAARGVDAAYSASATAGMDDIEAALALGRARMVRSAWPDFSAFQARVGAFLLRRGFSYTVAREALRTAWNETHGAAVDADLDEDPV